MIRNFLVLLLVFGSSSLLAQDAEIQQPGENSVLEGYNRFMHSVNDGLDSVVLKPLAKGYHAVTPDPVEQSVVNFFSNLGEITNIANNLLQGKSTDALYGTGRFLMNSTVGVAGFFDFAGRVGMEKRDGEDFGQTLGAWGVESGPYIVLPLLGPSTLRDAPARFVDTLTNPIGYVDHVPTRNSLYGSRVLSARTELLDIEELIEGDKYLFVKDAYLQRREYLINDGDVEDDFGSYEDF